MQRTVVPTPTPSPRMRRPTMTIARCTEAAMMAAPTTKVIPAKISGIWHNTTRPQMLSRSLLQQHIACSAA